MSGYARFYRESLHADVFADPNLWKVWSWCLLRAAHRPEAVSLSTGRGTTTVNVQPGQLVFGRHAASEALHMPPASVQDRMNRLQSLGRIKIESVTHFSIVTICESELYTHDTNEAPSSNRHPSVKQPSSNRHIQEPKTKEKNTLSRPALCFGPDDRGLAEHIWGKVHALQPSRKAPDLDRWANDLRLACETDGRTLEDLRDLFDRAHADPFWQRNILSPAKLREKFDDLDLKLRKTPTHGSPTKSPVASPARVRERDWSDVPIIRTGAPAGS